MNVKTHVTQSSIHLTLNLRSLRIYPARIPESTHFPKSVAWAGSFRGLPQSSRISMIAARRVRRYWKVFIESYLMHTLYFQTEVTVRGQNTGISTARLKSSEAKSYVTTSEHCMQYMQYFVISNISSFQIHWWWLCDLGLRKVNRTRQNSWIWIPEICTSLEKVTNQKNVYADKIAATLAPDVLAWISIEKQSDELKRGRELLKMTQSPNVLSRQ